jgi:hypothetical protein
MAAAHVPGVIERKENLPTAEDGYSYELDPVRQLDNADATLRGGVLYILWLHILGENSDKIVHYHICKNLPPVSILS